VKDELVETMCGTVGDLFERGLGEVAEGHEADAASTVRLLGEVRAWLTWRGVKPVVRLKRWQRLP
jgi:hypothetical protein